MKKRAIQSTSGNEVDDVYEDVKRILDHARSGALRSMSSIMVKAYWHIGKVIVEHEQKGDRRARYGKTITQGLAKRLTKNYGKGFNSTNIWYMKQFYLSFPNVNALDTRLTWTHYRMLLKVDGEGARRFYILEAASNSWSTRELDSQINSMLYERLAMSRDGEGVRELSTKGHEIRKPEDLLKDPFVLEFLGLNGKAHYHEKDLEGALIDSLKDFMLELGKGFSFVARQRGITLGGDHYYIDLVFYNYILKCFVLMELKVGKLTPRDIGQMDFYVRYFEKEERQDDDNPTIGLLLSSDKNEVMVKYTVLADRENIFSAKYRLYLPDEGELRRRLMDDRETVERERQLLN